MTDGYHPTRQESPMNDDNRIPSPCDRPTAWDDRGYDDDELERMAAEFERRIVRGETVRLEAA
jgi:hypothetical protein